MARDTMDMLAPWIDERAIDERIYDALKQRIRLQGLTLEIGPPRNTAMYPSQYVREAHLTDGHAHVVTHFTIELLNDPSYIAHIAHYLVTSFAEERYLIKQPR